MADWDAAEEAMLAVRWTIGDVNPRGFDALRLSIWGAWRSFGPATLYCVYVNTVGIDRARQMTGLVPPEVEWREARLTLPDWLVSSIDAGLAEGVAWKLVPMRAFPDRHEISLDNDVILWRRPAALSEWLARGSGFLVAEDVARCYGAFEDLCPALALNSGIRGLPPGFDLEGAMRAILIRRPVALRREADEQGLQIAALAASGELSVIRLDDVTLCSPFPPHLPHLGRSGAHFVGLNTRRLELEFDGRPAEQLRAEHWDAHVSELRHLVGSP